MVDLSTVKIKAFHKKKKHPTRWATKVLLQTRWELVFDLYYQPKMSVESKRRYEIRITPMDNHINVVCYSYKQKIHAEFALIDKVCEGDIVEQIIQCLMFEFIVGHINYPHENFLIAEGRL